MANKINGRKNIIIYRKNMTDEINVKVNKNPEDIFRVLSNELVSMRVSRDFEIELENGETITVNKYEYHYDHEDDADWDIIDGKEHHEAMSEEDQDKFYDFVQDLSVMDN